MQIKTIEIGGKPYTMKANMHIYSVYRDMYDEELPSVLEKVKKIQDNLNKKKVSISEVTKLTNEALKISWIMIKELDNSFMSFEDWEKELDSDMLGSWINEVFSLALQPFFGRKVPQDHQQSK